MLRYRCAARPLLLLGCLLWLAGCAIPSSRENVELTAQLLDAQVPAPLEWRRDPQADSAARQRAELLLADGLTLPEAIAVAFLASPDLQLALEQLEISRSDFVAAVTPPNPVAVIGTREPGGDLAAFYPDRSISIGVLQNLISLLDMPDRRAIARHDLQRARLEAARRATVLAAQVAQGWIDYSAALRLRELRLGNAALVRQGFDNAQQRASANAATELDVAAQRGALLTADASAVRATLAVETARAKLGEQLGIAGWRDDWQITAMLPPLPAADPDAAMLETAAIARRLDLRAAASTIDARLRILAMQRRFRWLNQLDVGFFRDKAIGGTAFTGPNAVVELALFDQRQAKLLNADAQLRTALRRLEAAQLAARSEIRTRAAELRASRQLLTQLDEQILPNQRQMLALMGAGDPTDPQRLRLRLAMLGTDEDRVALLRDYWRARSGLALAAGDWAAVSTLR
ncbi:MAG: TolC family protein [Steroidobacteraceae bacterium]